MDGYEVRPLDLDQVRVAVQWAESEGWEPGLTDADPFFAADPLGGFYGGWLDGQLVATMSAVRCSQEVAFVGFYIVAPEFRGKGYGKYLWDDVLSRYPGMSFGADSVPEQVASYETDGFRVAYGNARYSGSALSGHNEDEASLAPAGSVDFDALVEFDGRYCFGPRPAFLKPWIEGPGRVAIVARDDSNEITGFAASRRSGLGDRIGPVFSEDEATARSLILALAEKAGGRVAVDVPLPNQPAVDLLDSLGMERGFETARIYRGHAPELPLAKIFGVTSLELG